MNIKSGWQRREKEPKALPSSRAETLPMIEEEVRSLRVIAFKLKFFSFCGCSLHLSGSASPQEMRKAVEND